jgi:hypothetical protein
MRKWQFIVSTVLASLCLLLAIALMLRGQGNRVLERALRERQLVINQAAATQQRVQSVLVDMAQVSVQDDKMKDLLSRHGFTIRNNDRAK